MAGLRMICFPLIEGFERSKLLEGNKMTSPAKEHLSEALLPQKLPLHTMITEPNFIIFELFSVIPALRLPNRIVSGITWFRKRCEQRTTKREFYSVIRVEELPNRNCFGINSAMFLCVMVDIFGL